MFDRICADNGIRHLLTAPYSPTTTGKVERLHKTMRAEFFTRNDRMFATIAELQAALDGWVAEYNTARPHQSCGGRPPIERFRLANRSITADDSAATEPRAGGRQPRRRSPAGRGVAVGERGRARSPWPGSPTRSARPTPGSRSRSSWPAAWWTSCTPGWWSPPTPSGCAPTRPTGLPPDAGRPAGPGRHRRADRDPAGQRRRRGQLRRHRPTRPGGAGPARPST